LTEPKLIYTRADDGADMIEVAPGQAVNVTAALNLHLVTKADVEAARHERDRKEAA
jgi:hypothetical protein